MVILKHIAHIQPIIHIQVFEVHYDWQVEVTVVSVDILEMQRAHYTTLLYVWFCTFTENSGVFAKTHGRETGLLLLE